MEAETGISDRGTQGRSRACRRIGERRINERRSRRVPVYSGIQEVKRDGSATGRENDLRFRIRCDNALTMIPVTSDHRFAGLSHAGCKSLQIKQLQRSTLIRKSAVEPRTYHSLTTFEVYPPVGITSRFAVFICYLRRV